MLNSSAITLPCELSTTQKAARRVIVQCLKKMEFGCLTLIESFNSGAAEKANVLQHLLVRIVRSQCRRP